MIDVESANTPSKPEITALFTLFTLIVSAGSGLAAGQARRLLQALGIIVLSVALMLVVLVFLWNTPSVRAAEPSALPGLATAPYRAELLIDGPQSIRMWSSAPITLTVSVITNTVETAWPLPHSGPLHSDCRNSGEQLQSSEEH